MPRLRPIAPKPTLTTATFDTPTEYPQTNMQLPSPPASVSNGPSRQPSPPSQGVQQQGQQDMFLQLCGPSAPYHLSNTDDSRLQGPVVSVQVGSSRNGARYNLPAALFCHHSQLFRQDIAHYKTVRIQLHANKK